MEAIRNDTTKTLDAADILSMAGVKRPSEMQDKDAGLLKLADSIYESDLLKELRKDRQRLDWIQANWSRCGFISVGEFPIGKMREEIDAEMRGERDEEAWEWRAGLHAEPENDMSDPSFESYWNRVFALMESQHADKFPGKKFTHETMATFPISDLKFLMSAAFREGKNAELELTQSN